MIFKWNDVVSYKRRMCLSLQCKEEKVEMQLTCPFCCCYLCLNNFHIIANKCANCLHLPYSAPLTIVEEMDIRVTVLCTIPFTACDID